MVIEADREVREIVGLILTEEGYDVVYDAPWPVENLHKHQPDLIILDEWINEKEGHLLCTELKDLHETQHVPVIIFSTQHNIAEIALKCRAEGYVSKPFDVEALINEVQKCLDINTTADIG
nr:response regulator [Mucilaginibacter sp. Bleaf8]